MSEQRETWLPWSDTAGDYGLGFGTREECQRDCEDSNQHYVDARDFRPVYIPTPAELAELRRDAARYRWLRDESNGAPYDSPSVHTDSVGGWMLFYDELDTAIDSAMKGGE